MTSPTRKTSRPPTSKLSERTPALEWIAAGFGLVLTLGVIGYLGYQGLNPSDGPPLVVARAGPAIRTPSGYVVEIRALNQGRTTAAAVEIEGVLSLSPGEAETAAITFDYLPAGGERKGGLVFRNDPRLHRLTLAAKGHVDP
jgi:uncharacterized protein (TIGR02588 family)